MKKFIFVIAMLVIAAVIGGAQNQAPVTGPIAPNGFAIPNVNLIDDFLGNTPATSTTIGQLGWDSTVVSGGTNPVAATASVANHPGLITLTTAATTGDGVYVSLGHAVGVLFPGNTTNWQAEWIQEYNQISTGSTRIGFGTVDSSSAIPTNGIYIRYLQGTDSFLNVCSDTSSTETCGATTILPTAADYVDIIMSSSATGTISVTVNDITTPATSTIRVCSSGCNVTATPPTGVLSPMFSIVSTSNTADVLTVDYWNYQQIAAR
jgi:hypothetical protein